MRRVFPLLLLTCLGTLSAVAGLRPRTFRLAGQPVTSPLPASNTITDVLVDNPDIWLGTGKGLSTTRTETGPWTNYYRTDAFGTEDISALALGQAPGTHARFLIAATGHSEDVQTDLQTVSFPVGTGLRWRYTTDTVWHTVAQPLDDPVSGKSITYGRFTYTANPITVPEQNIIYDVAVTPGGTIFVASYAGGLRRSTDMGATWSRVFLPGDGTLDITPTADTAYSFELDPFKNLNQRAFSVVAASDSLLFVGTARGIDRSTDGGVSWHRFSHHEVPGISGNFVVALALQIAGGTRTLWAATIDADRTADPTEQRAVSFTTDDGETWHTADAFRNTFTHNFGFLGTIVYAATDTGLFRSDDHGLTWTVRTQFSDSRRRQRVVNPEVFAVGARASDSLVLIGTGDGLVTAHETGAFATAVNIFHASKGLASGSDTYAYPSPFSPAQEVTRIHYRVADPGVSVSGHVTIEIYDFALDPVRTIVRNALRDNDREYDELWDGRTDDGRVAANGVYHYSVRVDDGARRWGKILLLQ